ncbi:MAG: spore coat protein [Christensenellales bacterium]|jgi:spore coat protein F
MNIQLNMSEQDMLEDLLTQEKQFISAYSTYITEASCPNLRHILMTNFDQSCEDQYMIFDLMRKKGYYCPKDAQDNEVNTVKQKFTQMKNQLH